LGGKHLTQLSYFRVDPTDREPFPRSLQAASIYMILLGLFHAFVALKFLATIPRSIAFDYLWTSGGVMLFWSIAFVVIGIAISRLHQWTRPVLLGLMATYVMINISRAILNIGMSMPFMIFQSGLAANFVQIAILSLAVIAFIWFCFPQIDAAFTTANAKYSRLADLPILVSSWAVGCTTFGVIALIEDLPFFVKNNGNFAYIFGFLVIPIILVAGGVLTLFRKRYALIAATLTIFVRSILSTVAIATTIKIMRHATDPAGAKFLRVDVVLEAVYITLCLTGALVGLYAARLLRPAAAIEKSVQMQNHLRQP
jgi:hypothetical protein